MPADVHKKVYCLPRFTKRNYAWLMKTIYNSHTFEVSDIAKYRQHILVFFYKHGCQATLDAFGVKRSTVYDWKKAYETSGKRLVSLVPQSTKPRHVRNMNVDPAYAALIKSFRQTYGNISKYKLKLFLDAYAKEHGKVSYGTTKINTIIKRHHYYYDGKQHRKKSKQVLGTRIRYAPKETLPGYIQMDSIILYVLNVRYCFMTAIDVVTKFAHCRMVASLAARHAVVTLQEFTSQYGQPIRIVQTDNGSEFLGDFHAYLEQQAIEHYFSYPRSPKVNSTVERFNRTVQEEFINRCDEIYYDLPKTRQKLTHYLLWYNQTRPHHSLKMLSPMQFIQQMQ